MTDEAKIAEYRAAIQAAVVASKMLVIHDVPDLLEAIERAHAVGPMLDPTLYRDKAKAMDEDKEILEAALPLWRLGRKLQARIEGRPSSSAAH